MDYFHIAYTHFNQLSMCHGNVWSPISECLVSHKKRAPHLFFSCFMCCEQGRKNKMRQSQALSPKATPDLQYKSNIFQTWCMSNSSVLPRSRAYSQTYDYCTQNKFIVFLLVNMGINEAYGGISLFPVSCKYHFTRSGMAAYERNCVNANVAPILNRPKKCTLKDSQLEQRKRKQ